MYPISILIPHFRKRYSSFKGNTDKIKHRVIKNTHTQKLRSLVTKTVKPVGKGVFLTKN